MVGPVVLALSPGRATHAAIGSNRPRAAVQNGISTTQDTQGSDATVDAAQTDEARTISAQGVIQGPGRWNRGTWIFRDSTLQSLEVLLDEAFRVPGTNLRFGIDGIIGLVPGVGDVLAGLLSLVIPWRRGFAAYHTSH